MPRILLILSLLIGLLGGVPSASQAQTAPVKYYLDFQFLLSGRSDDIDTLLRVSNTLATEIERIDIAYVNALPPVFSFPLPRDGAPQIRLYRIRNPDVHITIARLNATAASTGLQVKAEANYLIGRDPVLAQGNPWSIGGSPWSIGGSGGSGGGSAYADFAAQWALGPQGIELYRVGDPPKHSLPYRGVGVEIAIFDTSPFSLGDTLSGTLTITRSDPDLSVLVEHPGLRELPEANASLVAVGDHGLFVASLAHAVAPSARYRLVQVLDQYGRGDLFTLVRELHRVVNTNRKAKQPTVINLSLGVHPPPNAAELGLPAALTALESAILAADGFGISVVAASGNDGSTSSTQLPAAYPSVIAVSGSTYERGRSCFANRGELAAPAGNGADTNCTPDLSACKGDCPLALIGAYGPEPSAKPGYAYWLGTSFAAPLVSGAAALLAERDPQATPKQIAAALAASATPPAAADAALGAGIINVRRMFIPHELHIPLIK